MLRIYLGFIICFLLTVIVFPTGIKLIAKLKAEQEILHYVESHAKKSGTPTMGGIIFVITIAGVAFALVSGSMLLAALSIVITVGYGIIGFLDDFLKVHYRRNLGLKAYQKIVFQLSIAVVVGIFVYRSNLVGSTILIPFTLQSIDLGILIIPFVVIIFLSCTNCVNLTDGLDGLAGSVSLIYLVGFVGIGLVTFPLLSQDTIQSAETQNLLIFAATAAGGMLGFLCFNAHPAKVFMGDTGSLALGGCIATISIFSRTELLIPILGIMFVLSGISVIIQVLHYKRTKQRVFLMSPLHHHFEKKGVHESKIVTVYSLITFVCAVSTFVVYYLVSNRY